MSPQTWSLPVKLTQILAHVCVQRACVQAFWLSPGRGLTAVIVWWRHAVLHFRKCFSAGGSCRGGRERGRERERKSSPGSSVVGAAGSHRPAKSAIRRATVGCMCAQTPVHMLSCTPPEGDWQCCRGALLPSRPSPARQGMQGRAGLKTAPSWGPSSRRQVFSMHSMHSMHSVHAMHSRGQAAHAADGRGRRPG